MLNATQGLLTESAHNALNDPEILDHSMEFATDVVGDDVVQRTSGEALRNTVTYAVQPSLANGMSYERHVVVSCGPVGVVAICNSRSRLVLCWSLSVHSFIHPFTHSFIH